MEALKQIAHEVKNHVLKIEVDYKNGEFSDNLNASQLLSWFHREAKLFEESIIAIINERSKSPEYYPINEVIKNLRRDAKVLMEGMDERIRNIPAL